MFPISTYIALLLFAIFVGTIIGIIGIGGGILLLPFLIYFDFSIQQAVAISLFLNAIPNTLPALYMYYKEGFFLIKPSIIASIGTILGTILGGYIGSKKLISDKIIYRLYTFILLCLTIYMFYYYC